MMNQNISSAALSRAAGTIAVCLLLCSCGERGGGPSDGGRGRGPGGPVPATVLKVSARPLPVVISAVGRTEGSKEVEIRARVSGIVAKRAYEEGSSVAAGAPLFLIDPESFEIALARARASLAQAQARNEQARRDVSRMDELLAQKLISKKAAEDIDTELRSSSAAVLAAEAEVREAQLNLSYTRVSAPIAGITGRAQKSEGSLVTAGTESSLLTTLVQTDPIWVRFALSEAEYDQLRRAMRGSNRDAVVVTVTSASGTPVAVQGKLNFSGSTLDAHLGTIELRAEFANAGLALLPGQHVQVELAAGAQSTITVPRTAVLSGDRGKFVWVLAEDGKAAQREVETGRWIDADWEIQSGLQPGDSVIVDNLLRLRPGSKVEVPSPEGARAQAAPGAQGHRAGRGADAG